MWRIWLQGAVLVIAYALLSIRLFRFVDRYAATLFFWDQWDFLTGFFLGWSPWEIFLWQQGHVRNGLGVLPMQWSLWISSWDGFALARSVGWILLLAALLALVLKRRLFRRLSLSDLVIPVLFLGLGQFEALVSASNPAHSALPLLLLMGYALLLTLPRTYATYAGLLAINLGAIFTGYGFFIGLLTPLVLLLELRRTGTGGAVGRRFLLLCLGIAAGSVVVFFADWEPGRNPTCFPPSFEQVFHYPVYAALMFNRVLGLGGSGLWALGGALVVPVAVVAVLAVQLRGILRDPRANRPLVLTVLLIFSLAFVATATVGRSCFPDGPYRSRYVTCLIPAFLALYFACLSIGKRWKGTWITASFVAVLVACEFRTKPNDLHVAHTASRGRVLWALCYLEHEDVRICNQRTHFMVHPEAERIGLQERLRFLRERKLNLYDEYLRSGIVLRGLELSRAKRSGERGPGPRVR